MRQWFKESANCKNFSEIVIALVDRGYKTDGRLHDLIQELSSNDVSITGKTISMDILRKVDFMDINDTKIYEYCKSHVTVLVSQGGKVNVVMDTERYQDVTRNENLGKLLHGIKDEALLMENISELTGKLGNFFSSVWVVDFRR